MKEGVAVDEAVWQQVCTMAAGNLDVNDVACK